MMLEPSIHYTVMASWDFKVKSQKTDPQKDFINVLLYIAKIVDRWVQTQANGQNNYSGYIAKFASAVLWSKTAIFREVSHSMKMPKCCWPPRAFIPYISTFKRGM